MSIIHIAHKQSDEVLDFITEEQYWADERIRELAGNRDTLDFETFADEPYSGHLESRNRLIIETREGHFAEYIIEEARQVLESDGSYTKIVYANASYSEIGKQKILPPQTFTARTASQHVAEALAGTEWQVGNVDFNGVATMTLDQHTNAYAFLQRIATEFNFELVFRVEHNGHRITGRYVDLVKTQGKWQGYEIVVGHNLKGFERIRKSGGIVTALIGVGPEITDAEGKNTGERHIVFVEDEDALQRWGRNGIHLVDVYEPQSDDQEMTENELRKYTRTELNKRTNAIAEYTADVDTLADMAGVDSGEIRFGDYVRVKDEWFSPPLYVAARIYSMTESIKEHGDVQITLGDYVEYTQDEVMALLNRFRSEINNKLDWDAVTEIVDRNSEPRRVQQATPPEDTRVIWVDTSGGEPYVAKVYDGARWVKMSPTVAGEIGAATPEEAQTIAEIEQAAVIRRIMNQSLHELDTEYTTLDGNEFLIDTPERTSLNSKKAAATTAHGKVISHIDNMLADGEISTAERSTFVTLIQAAEDAFAEYRAALAVAHDKVAAGRAKVAEDKAALAEKAAEDAQTDADTALSGLLTKIDESTYNKKVGELEAAIAEAGDTTEIDAALTTLQGEIDAAEAELAKVDGKISAAKQAMATDATNKANAAQTAAIEDAEGKLAAARTALETAISDAETAAAETAIADAEAKLAAARTEILSTASTDAQTKATAAKNAAIKDAETKLAAARTAIDTATQEAADAARDAAIEDAEGKIAAAKTSLETAIGTKADADSVYTTTEVDNALAGKVSTTTYTTDKDGIVSRLDSAETSISQNATAIQSKASTEIVDTIAGRVETAETTLTQHAKALTSKAETSVVNALTGRVDTAETTITQHATAIQSKAEQSELDTVSGVASSAKTTAEQTALALTTKAEAEEVNAIEGRVTSAETTISQHATAISSKAEKTELDTVSGVATSAQTLAEQTAEGLKSKASTASVNTLSGRVDTAESTLEQHAGLISSKVAQTTFETELGKKEGSIPKGTTPPTTKTKDMLWLDTSSTPNVMKRWSGTAWVKATPTTAAEVGAYSSSAGSALAGRVTTTESTIEQHAGLIASKVEKTTFDAVEGRLDTAETTISQHATAISSKAEQSSLDTVSDTATSAMTLAEQTAEGLKSKASTSSVNTLTGRVDEAESTIEQHAGLIASKVEKTTFDAVEGRVDKAETTLTQHATAISSKASQSELDTVSGVASSAKTTAEQTANALKSKAETSVVNTLTGRVETAESTLEQHAGLIASKVEQETFDAVEGRLDTAETTITQHATAISSKASQSSLDTVSGIASSAKTTAEQTANALKSKAETSTVNAIAGRVDTAETTIEQHAGLIASKAEQSSLDTVSGIATSAKTTAEQTAEALKTKAEVSTVNTLTGRVETAETTIGQHATAISSKAEKSVVDTVSGTATSALTLAEQTAEGLKSKAEKTYVDTAVRVKGSDGGSVKTFSDVLAYQKPLSGLTGMLIIRTPITPSKMVNLHLGGYNYVTGSNTIDVDIGFYHYSSSVLQHGFNSKGTYSIDKVRVGRDANNRAVIIIGEPTTKWSYPAITVDKAIIGYSLPPDSYKDGWSADYITEDPEDVTLLTELRKFDLQATISNHSTSIEQTAEAIKSKAEKSELDTVSGVANSAKTTAEQTAEGLKSKAEQQTVNAIDGRLQTAEGTITQHATAISQRVTTTTHNALAGRVSTAEGQITTMAGQIELKASSESVQQLGERVDGVEESVTSSEVRISDVELQLGEGAITSTVLNSVQFETMFAQKANAEDLAGYATSDAVENLVNTVEGMGEDIRGIQSQEFVTQTEIEQRDLSLITTISASSGVNLLRNSVGLAGLEHWAIAGDGTVSPTGSTELNALGYHSGFLLEGASSGVTRLTQDVSVLVGKSYTLSFALRNVNTNGNIQVNVIDAIRGTLITTAPAFTETGAGNYGNVNVTVDSVPSSQLRIEIVVPAAKNAIITALMLNIGTVPFAWTTAVGELYNTTMKVDLNGIRVSQYDADIETGFTVMTPRKFAGYYNESGFIDETTGSDDEVFRVDRDEFVMKKATVSGEITMGTYKIIPIDTTARKGWAFVPN